MMDNKHTNLLIHESSPYLLQHAHNPVNWFPWGDAALEKAKKEDKPILISIGYSACHWCHVMERESFEDEETAEIMNKFFVNIKIDREERPDLDHIYMDAVQAITGSGGWPLNVFLTPDRKPFFGGTYFPPVNAHNRSSWKNVLLNIHQVFTEKRDEVDTQADGLTKHLINSVSISASADVKNSESLFTKENLSLIADNILKQADTVEGGFGNAPKFPQTFSIQYLLRHYHFTKDENSLKHALLSLDKMIAGGIYDHLGGGFARYSTDREWLAPHFEKMLYDNALLINVISEAYQLTKNEIYAQTIKDTLSFLERELLSSEFGFYSALDADSEGIEGKYYVWTKREIEEILGDESTLFCAFYDVSEKGNWDGVNILRVTKNADDFAKEHNIYVEYLQEHLNKAKRQLLQARNFRVRPQLDDKILLGWNGLMITAICKAYAALEIDRYKELAINAISFIESKMKEGKGGYFHTYKNEKATIGAFLDDYAYLIQAYINLQEITGNQNYLKSAKELTEFVIENFQSEMQRYFCFTPLSQTDVIFRKEEVYDGAIPSGNSVMTNNLLYLSVIFDNKNWKDLAIKNIIGLEKAIINHPVSFGFWAISIQLLTIGYKEVVFIGRNILKDLPEMLKMYVPNKIIQTTSIQLDFYPLLAVKLVSENSEYYLCSDNNCLPVFNSLDKFFEKVLLN